MPPQRLSLYFAAGFLIVVVGIMFIAVPISGVAQEQAPTPDCSTVGIICIQPAPSATPIPPLPPIVPPSNDTNPPTAEGAPAPPSGGGSPEPVQPTSAPAEQPIANPTKDPNAPPVENDENDDSEEPEFLYYHVYSCQVRINGVYTDMMGWYMPPNGQRQLVLADGNRITENSIAYIDPACEDYYLPPVDEDGFFLNLDWIGCTTMGLTQNISAVGLNLALINAYARHSNEGNRCAAVLEILRIHINTIMQPAPMPLIDANELPDDCAWAIPEFIDPWEQYGQLVGGNFIAQAVYEAALAQPDPCVFIYDIVRDNRLPDGYPVDYIPELLPLVCNPNITNDLYVLMVDRLRRLRINQPQIEVLRAVGSECALITYLSRAGAYVGSHIDLENRLVDVCQLESIAAIEYTMLVVSTGLNPNDVRARFNAQVQLSEGTMERAACVELLNSIIADLLEQTLPMPLPPSDSPLAACDPTLLYTFQTMQLAARNNPILEEQMQQLQLSNESSAPCHTIENYVRTGYAIPEPDILLDIPFNYLETLRKHVAQRLRENDRAGAVASIQLPAGELRNAAAVFVARTLPEAPGDLYLIRNGFPEPFVITDDKAESFPVLSADGRHVAYIERNLETQISSVVIQEIPQIDENGQKWDAKKFYLFQESDQNPVKIAPYPMAFTPDANFLLFTVVEKLNQPGERYSTYSIYKPLVPGYAAAPFLADTHSPTAGAILDAAPELMYLAVIYQLGDNDAEIYLRAYRRDEKNLRNVTAQSIVAGNRGNARIPGDYDCNMSAFTINFITLYFKCNGTSRTNYYVYELTTDAIYPLNLPADIIFNLSPGPERGFMVYDDGRDLFFIQRQDSGVIGDKVNAGTALEIHVESLVPLSLPNLFLSHLRWAAPEAQGVPVDVTLDD